MDSAQTPSPPPKWTESIKMFFVFFNTSLTQPLNHPPTDNFFSFSANILTISWQYLGNI